MLAERVPNSVVLASPGKMVSATDRSLLLVGDDAVKDGIYILEESMIAVEVFGDENTGAVEKDAVPFILEACLVFQREGTVWREGVDGDVAQDGIGKRVLCFRGSLRANGFEDVQRRGLGCGIEPRLAWVCKWPEGGWCAAHLDGASYNFGEVDQRLILLAMVGSTWSGDTVVQAINTEHNHDP